jgi:hypothetical protein
MIAQEVLVTHYSYIRGIVWILIPDCIRIPDQIGTSEPSSELQINMAAVNVNAMRTMFVCIGFTFAAAQVIVEEQGMDALEEIQLLTDGKIENLCKVIRRPGVRSQDQNLVTHQSITGNPSQFMC